MNYEKQDCEKCKHEKHFGECKPCAQCSFDLRDNFEQKTTDEWEECEFLDSYYIKMSNEKLTLEQVQIAIKQVLKVQGYDGNWDYDPYMQGLYNGLLLADTIASGGDYKPRSRPKWWGYQKARFYRVVYFWRRNKPVAYGEVK